ncbi:hypothetical protein [uncultured Kocuria sp.]|uniref:acyltransferase n=1 Tax=uncultured Kocuria sp. TaxID=259305 RepID=UPI0025FFBE19|nr:hypothetical protein [uncultured Kocuria sp.]
MHYGMGTVVDAEVTLGDRLRIDQNVIIGRQDAHLPREQSPFGRLHFGDDAVLFPGCVVLGRANRIGAGSTVGDNSVLTGDTGENEIWAGSPARKVGVLSGPTGPCGCLPQPTPPAPVERDRWRRARTRRRHPR